MNKIPMIITERSKMTIAELDAHHAEKLRRTELFKLIYEKEKAKNLLEYMKALSSYPSLEVEDFIGYKAYLIWREEGSTHEEVLKTVKEHIENARKAILSSKRANRTESNS